MSDNGTDMSSYLDLLASYFAFPNIPLIIAVLQLQYIFMLAICRTAKVWLYSKLPESGNHPQKSTKQHFHTGEAPEFNLPSLLPNILFFPPSSSCNTYIHPQAIYSEGKQDLGPRDNKLRRLLNGRASIPLVC